MTTDSQQIDGGASGPAPRSLEAQLLSQEFTVPPDAFWSVSQLRGDDGYDRIEAAATRGWHPVPSWGGDGWDLGSWPLAVISHRHTPEGYELAYNVEGDITVYRYPTRELRDAATDCLAFWHWKHDAEPWVEGIDSVDVAPDYLRGPFSWSRLEGSQR